VSQNHGVTLTGKPSNLVGPRRTRAEVASYVSHIFKLSGGHVHRRIEPQVCDGICQASPRRTRIGDDVIRSIGESKYRCHPFIAYDDHESHPSALGVSTRRRAVIVAKRGRPTGREHDRGIECPHHRIRW
jgi:hypothetical protein